MKNLILYCLVTLNSISAFAQNKEIDRLYSIYKDDSTIVIYSTFGEIYADIYIKKNADNKPESIIIRGNSNNLNGIIEIVTGLVKQKIQQGYTKTSGSSHEYIRSRLEKQKEIKDIQARNSAAASMNLDNSGFEAVYRKGDDYFIISINYGVYYSRTIDVSRSGLTTSLPPEIKHSEYTFSLENGDNSRKGGAKARPLDF